MTPQRSILIVEDEAPIRSGLEDVFVFHGYRVESAEDGPQGLRKALAGGFDMILLDLMLPGMNGFDICERVRALDQSQPIIMLTALAGDEDVVRGLKLGADDYVSKPFSVTQLVLRVEAVLRRARPVEDVPERLLLGNLDIDCLSLLGQRGDEQVPFTRREIELLQYLAAHHDRPVAEDELLHQVWGYPKRSQPETRTVAIHVGNLRKKIERDRAAPEHLVTVRGAGYRLVLESPG